jgi:basic membrane lipoprotein Med (substrate-binding protein (PBP1-ABC) superfamily)
MRITLQLNKEALMKLKQISLTLVSMLAAASAYAADPKFAVIYDAGGKFDKSFNQSASEGAERFKKETKIGFMEYRLPAIHKLNRFCAIWPVKKWI